MNWNEFNKELRNRNIDPQQAYMFGLIYERQLEMAKQIDLAAKAVLEISKVVEKVVSVNVTMRNHIEALEKSGRVEGVDVHSETILDDPNRKDN